MIDNEKKVLQLYPKFSIMENLLPGWIDFDQESSNAKLRMSLSKEYEEELDEEDEVSITEEERNKIDEISAMSRQTFDPVNKIYDDRKMRAIYLRTLHSF